MRTNGYFANCKVKYTEQEQNITVPNYCISKPCSTCSIHQTIKKRLLQMQPKRYTLPGRVRRMRQVRNPSYSRLQGLSASGQTTKPCLLLVIFRSMGIEPTASVSPFNTPRSIPEVSYPLYQNPTTTTTYERISTPPLK